MPKKSTAVQAAKRHAASTLRDIQDLKRSARGGEWEALHQCEGRLVRLSGAVRRPTKKRKRRKP